MSTDDPGKAHKPTTEQVALGKAGLSMEEALRALRHLLLEGNLPSDLPEALRNAPDFREITNQIETLQQFALTLASGDLEPDLKMKGRAAGALKSLQANLRHLTWQAQRIADGDFNQRVRFMGDFSDAFNAMVENLQQSRQALQDHARELEEGRRVALELMRQTEIAYQKLQEQMEETKALQEQLREQAIRDPLTGCFNRRYLDETLGREFARAGREGYPLSLVMCDIDHFKRINDSFGHQAGDAMLKATGDLLRQHSRAGDIVCRYGGEEFLVVLPNMDLQTAARRAQDWRNEFRKLQVMHDGNKLQATISLGVAAFPTHGNQEQVVKAADQAMYQAKNSGRDRVFTPESGIDTGRLEKDAALPVGLLRRDLETLQKTALFRGLEQDEVRRALQTCQVKEAAADSFIFMEDDQATLAYVILEGKVKLTQVALDGQQVIQGYLGSGRVFGVISALKDVTYPVSAQAAAACRLAVWGRHDLNRLMLASPRMAFNVLYIMSGQIREFQNRVRELSTQRVERRIARTLLRLASQAGRKVEQGVLVDLPLSRQDLAEMSGTTLYTVSRVLKNWEGQGLILSKREQVIICSSHGLVSIAEDFDAD